MQHPPLGLLSALSLDLLSHLSWLQSRPRHSKPKYRLGSVHVSVSVSFSYAGDLVVERLVSTYPILPLLPSYSYQYLHPSPVVDRSAQPEHLSILCLTLFRRRWHSVYGFDSGLGLTVPVSSAHRLSASRCPIHCRQLDA